MRRVQLRRCSMHSQLSLMSFMHILNSVRCNITLVVACDVANATDSILILRRHLQNCNEKTFVLHHFVSLRAYKDRNITDQSKSITSYRMWKRSRLRTLVRYTFTHSSTQWILLQMIWNAVAHTSSRRQTNTMDKISFRFTLNVNCTDFNFYVWMLVWWLLTGRERERWRQIVTNWWWDRIYSNREKIHLPNSDDSDCCRSVAFINESKTKMWTNIQVLFFSSIFLSFMIDCTHRVARVQSCTKTQTTTNSSPN